MKPEFKSLKYACYSANMSMSVVGNLSPLLFITFRTLYGISYSLLGLLVLVNFVTQLTVDLIFSFFSHKFNIPKTVKLAPLLTIAGLLVYAVCPIVFPQGVYLGLVVGTIIFSASSGLNEVLLSPVIAAIPAEDPDHEMSKLHSVYAWGVVLVIIVSTLFLLVFGSENWQWLAILFTLIPLASFYLYSRSEIPRMETPKRVSGALQLLKNKGIWLCVAAIFFGGASECTMAQWSSGYLEQALGIPKVWGDIFGAALFAAMLGLGRSLYAKFGKNIDTVLFFSSIGAVLCYLTAALSGLPIAGLIACALTGLFTAMLWPGSLIIASDRFPQGGVFIFAMMAAGGDLGASVGPQLIGLITDAVIAHPGAVPLAQSLGLGADQLGMKLGMLTGMIFPLCAVPLYFYIRKNRKEKNNQDISCTS